jgi:glutamate-1-semialdehyde 2,1-aminomutase/spore coat polysaccharide biosynthesis protein SpsF
MKIVIIIQARMDSTRLPRKVLFDLEGKSVLQRVYERSCDVKNIDKAIIATTVTKEDDELVYFCHKNDIPIFRGSKEDVLDRYYRAAKMHHADAIIRITGDCPLIDPQEVDKVVEKYINGGFDFVSNYQPPMLPDGLDASIGSFSAYEKSWHEAKLKSEREHVTPYIINHPADFKVDSVTYDKNYSHLRWTVDEPEDYEFIRKIYKQIKENHIYGHLNEVLNILQENPELNQINSKFERNEGLKKSETNDKIIILNTNFNKSGSLLKRGKKTIPIAASTYSKSYRYFCEGAAPAILERGLGSHVWDVDENEYIDYVLALGPVSVGYNDKRVNKAIKDQLKKGLSFSLTTELEIKLAEKLIEIIPCAEMVKFVKNGSDATAAAVRLARAHTKRDIILCCGYHGWQDWYIGTTENDLGVPQSIKKLTLPFPYNNIKALEKLFCENKDNVAAVIIEPISLQLPRPGYLESVKEVTHKNGALLIFDEVVTGFRLSLAGGQEYFGVIPDMAAFGKAMANGMAISALVGRRDILNLIEEGAFISTTFGGETLAIAAALKTIEILEKEKAFEKFASLGSLLMEGMKKIVLDLNLNNFVEFIGLPFHFGVKFKDIDQLTAFDLFSVFQQEAIRRGILTLGVHNFCLAHSEEDIKATLEAYTYAFELTKQAIDASSVDGILRGGKFSPIFKRDSSR